MLLLFACTWTSYAVQAQQRWESDLNLWAKTAAYGERLTLKVGSAQLAAISFVLITFEHQNGIS